MWALSALGPVSGSWAQSAGFVPRGLAVLVLVSVLRAFWGTRPMGELSLVVGLFGDFGTKCLGFGISVEMAGFAVQQAQEDEWLATLRPPPGP